MGRLHNHVAMLCLMTATKRDSSIDVIEVAKLGVVDIWQNYQINSAA
jgi:hypothetical protein